MGIGELDPFDPREYALKCVYISDKDIQYIQMLIPAPVDQLSLRLFRHLLSVVRTTHPVSG